MWHEIKLLSYGVLHAVDSTRTSVIFAITNSLMLAVCLGLFLRVHRRRGR